MTSAMPVTAVTVRIASGRPETFTVGREYVITYRLGLQEYDREAQMSFLGTADVGAYLVFNARPAGGTQQFPPSAITSVTDIGPSCGRDHPSRYIGRRAA